VIGFAGIGVTLDSFWIENYYDWMSMIFWSAKDKIKIISYPIYILKGNKIFS